MSAAARSQAKSAQLNPNWPHYASAALTVAVLIGSFLRWGLLGTLMRMFAEAAADRKLLSQIGRIRIDVSHT